ncbi:MerR family transcriptional regulator [Pseudoduganella umbonata]|uniref:Cobalamin B12-binding domain-containing protein n=1 Tax=Pseudoduganella umbonata TaxID=864828 RepID=A0A4P8HQN1_9BURK|nr:cobalamin B12-binding domain-containing protein [Pseudoduganella umbonata]MBB3225061.1 methanogenic corrinoid protein MtbC1 [Pseudoduganella umbonata]QCP11466.1 cobalamin B12-binding domain-containing protein [Pseudoduganella umbonata]
MSDVRSIAAISLETGIAKEVLRKWEERYGFPVPERDASGHRTYAAQQTVRLLLIKRLINSGKRPSQVVPLNEEALHALLHQQDSQTLPSHANTRVVSELMDLLHARDRLALDDRLHRELQQAGLEKFVTEVMSALNIAVGTAWEQGRIGVRDEHMYSESIQRLIRQGISRVARREGRPRMLFTTPSGELHTLGILMVEALASQHGACCISLGAQTPVEEIPLAAADCDADIVCLCFSAAFPKRQIVPYLRELRSSIPPRVEIWTGGAGTGGLDRLPRGIKVLPTLQGVIDAVQGYGVPKSRRSGRQGLNGPPRTAQEEPSRQERSL